VLCCCWNCYDAGFEKDKQINLAVLFVNFKSCARHKFRDKKMKQTMTKSWFFLTLGIATITFFACSKDDDSEGNDKNAFTINAVNVINGSDRISTVSAVIWRDEISRQTIAQTQFQNNGFTLQLPATVSDEYLEPLFYSLEEGITISNTVRGVSFWNLRAYNSDDNRIGILYYASADFDDDVDNIMVAASWIYVDRNVTVSGQIKGVDERNGIVYEYINNYNLTLRRGWNIIYEIGTINELENNITYTHTFSSQRPSRVTLNWYFNDYEDFTASINSARILPVEKDFSTKLNRNRKR